MIDLHITELQAFNGCRKAFDYSSRNRQSLTPIAPHYPFIDGLAVHDAIEHYYRDGVTFDTSLKEYIDHEVQYRAGLGVSDKDLDLLASRYQMLLDIMLHYQIWAKAYRGKFSDHNLEWLGYEDTFEVPIFTPRGFRSPRFRLVGRIDGLVQCKDDKSIWIIDHKTTASIARRKSFLPLDLQATAYVYALEYKYGRINPRFARNPDEFHIQGILYNFIAKRVPQSPEILKNGMLSKNKAVKCTAEWYLMNVRNHHHQATNEFIRSEYGDIITALGQQPNDYFERIPITRTPQQLKTFADELYTLASEVTDKRMRIFRQPGINCGYCVFKEPCFAGALTSEDEEQIVLHDKYTNRVFTEQAYNED